MKLFHPSCPSLPFRHRSLVFHSWVRPATITVRPCFTVTTCFLISSTDENVMPSWNVCFTYFFACRQKPLNECWKAVDTHLTRKTQNGSLSSQGEMGHFKKDLYLFHRLVTKTYRPFYPYIQQMPPVFSCISFFFFAKVSCRWEI